MHAFNLTAKNVALACSAVLVGWVEQAAYEVLTLASVVSCWKNILPYITLYSNSTKTGAGQFEEFSPRRLTIFDICLDLSLGQSKTTWILDRNTCHSLPLAHSDKVAPSRPQVS